MSGFDQDLLQRLEREREVRVRTRRRDGSTTDLPIWVVTVDGEPYIRSYRAERGAWYRRARAEGRLTLVVGDRAFPALARLVADQELNQRISTAFTAFTTKYGKGGPARTMVSPAVAATTLRLAPAS